LEIGFTNVKGFVPGLLNLSNSKDDVTKLKARQLKGLPVKKKLLTG